MSFRLVFLDLSQTEKNLVDYVGTGEKIYNTIYNIYYLDSGRLRESLWVNQDNIGLIIFLMYVDFTDFKNLFGEQ